MKIKQYFLQGAAFFLIGLVMRFFTYDDGLRLIIEILFNPLMIYVYDYLIDSNRLISKKYPIIVIACFLLELVSGVASFPYLFLLFPIQAIMGYKLAQKRIRKAFAVPALIFFPLIAYTTLSFVLVTFVLGMSAI